MMGWDSWFAKQWERGKNWDPLTHKALEAVVKRDSKNVEHMAHTTNKWFGDPLSGYLEGEAQKNQDDPRRGIGRAALTVGALYGGALAAGAGAGSGAGAAAGSGMTAGGSAGYGTLAAGSGAGYGTIAPATAGTYWAAGTGATGAGAGAAGAAGSAGYAQQAGQWLGAAQTAKGLLTPQQQAQGGGAVQGRAAPDMAGLLAVEQQTQAQRAQEDEMRRQRQYAAVQGLLGGGYGAA